MSDAHPGGRICNINLFSRPILFDVIYGGYLTGMVTLAVCSILAIVLFRVWPPHIEELPDVPSIVGEVQPEPST